MSYLIDTNIWSHLQRRSTEKLLQKFATLQSNQVFLSPIVRGELETGYLKGDRAPARRIALDVIIKSAQALAINQQVALKYAELRTSLEKAGTPIGRNDTWIAAEALHHGLTVITDNLAEFERVQGLKVENWL